MAHQFSPSSGFGTGYPVPPFYPPFVQNPQQLSNVAQSYQQPGPSHSGAQVSRPQSNALRFDTNAHISSQSSPLPFPPSINPELFKHFPPPPPPPPSAFSAGPGSSTGFQQFSHTLANPSQAYGQHSFPPLPQSHTPNNGSFLQNQNNSTSAPPSNSPFTYGFNPIEHKTIEDFRYGTNLSAQSPVPGLALHNAHPEIGMRSNAIIAPVDERPIEILTDSGKGAISASSAQNDIASPLAGKQISYSMQAGSENSRPQSGLRENAKAAILSLLPHKIMYNDLLAEGIDSHVLQQLYTELGLSWKHIDARREKSVMDEGSKSTMESEPSAEQSAITQSNNTLQPPVQSTIASSSVKSLQGGSSVLRSTPIVNSGLERKDRIAQLLAAKTGKIGTVPNVSKSGSPASVTESTIAQPPLSRKSTPITETPTVPIVDPGKRVKTMPQTELVRQKMEQLRREAAEKLKVAEAAIAVPVSIAKTIQSAPIAAQAITQSKIATLPTPVRESLVREGFSSMIPGLFLTSADEEVANEDVEMISSNLPDASPTQDLDQVQFDSQSQSRSTTSNDLKRAAVDSPVEEGTRAVKRVASSRAESVDVEMDIDELGEDGVSEGEIIDDAEQAESDEPTDQENNDSHQITSQMIGSRTQQAYSLPTQSLQTGRSLHQNLLSNTGSRKVESFQQFENGIIVDPEQRKGSHMTQGRTDSIDSGPIAVQLPQKAAIPLSAGSQGNEISSSNERALISPKPLAKLTPTEFAERAAQLKADFMRQRALRQKQLVEGMPVLNDEVVKTQARLEQHRSRLTDIRREIRDFEAGIIRARTTEDQVLREIAHLEKQLQDGVSGQKQFSKELSEIKKQQEDDRSTSPKDLTNPQSAQVQPLLSSDTLQQPISQDSGSETVQTSNLDISGYLQQSTQHDNFASSGLSNETNQVAKSWDDGHGSSSNGIHSTVDGQSDDGLVANEIRGGEISAYVQDELKSHQTSVNGSENAEDRDENSEDDEPMDQSEDESEGTHMSVDQDSNGSASMSDSGSDDYEPPEPKPQSSSVAQMADSDYYEPSDSLQDPQYVQPDDAADEYEPLEVVEAVESTKQSPITGPASFSTSNANEPPSYQDETLPAVSEIIQKSEVDDQEQGLQLSEANLLTRPQDTADIVDPEVQPLSDSESISFPRFVPYQSPLSSFKSYRFHPEFAEQIKSGYRSLTYSNKIDPKKPICPTELTGEACTDPECEEQHFGSMALTDDKILVQMSSANDIKDKALRDQYLLGLKQVIARLRQEGVKEFPLVADALSKYRREWTASQTGL